jgi:1-acyl-sn-glycerol-3-phosphate acyltransferase
METPMVPNPSIASITDLYQDDFALNPEVDREVRHVPVYVGWQDHPVIRGLRSLAQLPTLAWVRLMANPRAAGVANIPTSGPLIFAANHRSHIDTGLILNALPIAIRSRVSPAAAKDFWFRRRLKSTLVRFYFNAIAVTRRGQGARTMVAEMVRYVRRGKGRGLLIYPEGGRQESGEKLSELKTGVARVALIAQAKIIPVAVTGSDRVMPKGQGVRRVPGHHCMIRFGKPLDPADYHYTLRKHEVRAARAMTNDLRHRLLELLHLDEEEAGATAGDGLGGTVVGGVT